MKQWYVVQTNPREEGVASSVLKQQGLDIYQPFMQRYVFHARKKTLKRYPLFPNYLFVNVSSSEEELHKVRWCRWRSICLPIFSLSCRAGLLRWRSC